MASIVSYNTELVATLEALRDQREDLHRSILRDEEEKGRIQKELTVLTERLGALNSDLAKKIHTRNEFDAAISETEGAYMKVSSLLAPHNHDGVDDCCYLRNPWPLLLRFCTCRLWSLARRCFLSSSASRQA